MRPSAKLLGRLLLTTGASIPFAAACGGRTEQHVASMSPVEGEAGSPGTGGAGGGAAGRTNDAGAGGTVGTTGGGGAIDSGGSGGAIAFGGHVGTGGNVATGGSAGTGGAMPFGGSAGAGATGQGGATTAAACVPHGACVEAEWCTSITSGEGDCACQSGEFQCGLSAPFGQTTQVCLYAGDLACPPIGDSSLYSLLQKRLNGPCVQPSPNAGPEYAVAPDGTAECCYEVAILGCTGRPLDVGGALRVATLRERRDWA